MPTPVIAIFDVGKTNKKVFLFDEQYRMVLERSAHFEETRDEDGHPCEDLDRLRLWVFDVLREIWCNKNFEVKAVNFSAYGASFVLVNEAGHPVAPLYNYLKQFPEGLKQRFYEDYGGTDAFSVSTASPVLGSLNSGMQLYRLRQEQPQVFARVKYALHLPQYMSFLLTGHACSDLTSIGCHTNLWHFEKGTYHRWVANEGIAPKLAPVEKCDNTLPPIFPGSTLKVGIGLHDSSAALVPYLLHFKEPFVLLSTGTWCISLNPFNNQPLTFEELHNDCLCYLTCVGNPVKASRLFAGQEHEQQAARIAAHFVVAPDFFHHITFNAELYAGGAQQEASATASAGEEMLKTSPFGKRELSSFSTPEEAYHQLMYDLVQLQHAATSLVLGNSAVKRLFVDGGFSKNKIFMNGLAAAFPGVEVYAASMAQASALGAALILHKQWNNEPIPANLIDLEYYFFAAANALT